LAEAYENLTNGVIFVKYGKYGKPKARHVFMQNSHICWRDTDSKVQPVIPK